MLPSLCGAGALEVYTLVSGDALNFVTLIAVLMMCGLTVDYGVFAADEHRREDPEPERTQSALLFCCLSSALGMVPMAFASHPVIKSLGIPLMLGVIAGMLGSFALVPAFLKIGRGRDAAA
jgi:predicted RND superfamily exporter protein